MLLFQHQRYRHNRDLFFRGRKNSIAQLKNTLKSDRLMAPNLWVADPRALIVIIIIIIGSVKFKFI